MATSFKTIEHTADIGIEVGGDSLQELFVNAAGGMFSLVLKAVHKGEEKIKEISLTAGIKEELLVRWLEELLFLFEEKHLFPKEYSIRTISEQKLESEVVFSSFDPEKVRPMHQIKAVTYHNLAIKEKNGRFSTKIIFDI